MTKPDICGENGEFVKVAEADCLVLADAIGKSAPKNDYSVGMKRELDDGGDEREATRAKEEPAGEPEEVWAIARQLNAGEDVNCETEDCGNKACALWHVLGDDTQKWNTCESCQTKDFGGWPEGYPKAM